MIEYKRKSTACFSGFRPEKFSFRLYDDHPLFWALERDIRAAVEAASADGKRTFLCGMAMGFDLLCADVLLRMRRERVLPRDTRLVAVLPHGGHGFHGEWGGLHRAVTRASDEVVEICPTYQQDCYALRNRYMTGRASLLICYWDGQEGGTAQTVRMAKRAGLAVHNLCEDGPAAQQSLW